MMSTPETAFRLISSRPPGARERRTTLAAARDVANDGYWEWNLATRAVEYSPRCREMLGITEALVMSSPSAWLDRVHPNDRDAVRAVIQRLSSGEQTRAQCEHRVRHVDGSYRWMMARAATVCDNQGLPNRVVGWLSDVTDRKTLERQYAGSARHDTMTGLPNRALLTDRLTDALEICKRGESGFALLVIDLNHFHRVNARFGDVGGDDVLRGVAQALRQAVRVDDVVARIGGDKFGILLLGDSLEGVAGGIATRIKKALRRPYRLANEEIFISATIGVVIGQSSYARAGEVLRDADSALDEGKRLGGDRVLVFQPAMHHAPAARLGRERDIRLAMERGEFTLHFQPMLGAPNGEVRAF
jgi:diguanylate cyclase (GGDEF)-like protein/PAS domain S-box-containing protein